MNNPDRFKYTCIVSNKDYDLNILCTPFIYELYDKRNFVAHIMGSVVHVISTVKSAF